MKLESKNLNSNTLFDGRGGNYEVNNKSNFKNLNRCKIWEFPIKITKLLKNCQVRN